MRRVLVVLLTLAMAIPSFALEGSEVAYAGGTISQLKEGAAGSLDMTSSTGLVFNYSGGRLEIPYGRIESYEQTQEVAVHLGVAPAIVVGILKQRRRNHYVRFTFRDGGNQPQVAIFEVAKTLPMVLTPTLLAKAPQARCGANNGSSAGYRPTNAELRSMRK